MKLNELYIYCSNAYDYEIALEYNWDEHVYFTPIITVQIKNHYYFTR